MTNYIYTPNRDNEFRCKVPLENTEQLFVVDGALQSNAIDEISGREEGGYAFKASKKMAMENMLQIISVRSSQENASYTNTFELENSAAAKLLLCSHT